jgi:nucleotide-binding universal stress UspA family protein
MKTDRNQLCHLRKHPAKRHRFLENGSGTPIPKILVPIDFSLQSKRAVEYAAMFVRRFGASITLLHVVKPVVSQADYGYGPVIRQIADDNLVNKAKTRLNAMRKTRLSIAAHAATIVRTGVPDFEIVRAAKDLGIGLIVMGSHSRATCQPTPIGGVAHSVVGLAPCPVLVVRTKDHGLSPKQAARQQRRKLNVNQSSTLN